MYKLTEKIYSWRDMSLWEYLEEGNIPSNWKNIFLSVGSQNILWNISEYIKEELVRSSNLIIYPPINWVFRSFNLNPQNIRVVILGQDPYHSGTTEFNGSAVGYCFSVRPGSSVNPSLKNIYKELKEEGYSPKEDGDLSHWVKQGCMMLNTALTVEKSCPDSHTEFWHDWIENIIKYIAENCEGVAWLLMGSKAQRFKKIIPKNTLHYVVCTSHPSPFSARRSIGDVPSFLGSGAFRDINDFLLDCGYLDIIW
jgi:uracil-DNA glycosylase